MQADLAFIQALRGAGLADADRKSLDADHLFLLTLRGAIELLPKERKRLAEHVPQRYVARIGEFQTPVTNFFHMLFLSSLIPELDFEFLWFCDDFILIGDLSQDMARRNRCLGDLAQTKNRGSGLWKESLWRTCDLLQRLKYPVYNFETHVPTSFTCNRSTHPNKATQIVAFLLDRENRTASALLPRAHLQSALSAPVGTE